MDGLLSISQLAKLRNVTTETLRHYDRIGLFKPTYTDPETNYRYYSIIQYEKLGTIKELKQLGFSLDEMKRYFENRNFQNSFDMLKNKHQEMIKHIAELQETEEKLRGKIEYLSTIHPHENELVPSIVEQTERYFITKGNEVESDEDMGYVYTSLESMLDEISPILATDRVGLITNADPSGHFLNDCWIPYIFIDNAINSGYKKSFPAGKYASITSYEGISNQQHAYDILLKYIKKKKLHPIGNVLLYFPIDLTITDIPNEFSFVMQVAVEKSAKNEAKK